MKDTYNDGYKTEDIKCIIVDFIAEDGKGGLPIMRQGTYVLCKDCKYWAYDNFNDEGEITDAWCSRPYAGFMSVSPDDFCSRGERRGKEDED